MKIMSSLCRCGCGKMPSGKGSQFVHGHHFRKGSSFRVSSKKPDIVNICARCKIPFVSKSSHRKTQMFCSRSCRGKFCTVQKTATLVCEYCARSFVLAISRHVGGQRGRFCSMFCRRAFETKRALRGEGEWCTLRKVIRKERGNKCEVCGYDMYPEILVVHHCDRVRDHNTPENLCILCPTHHAEAHLHLTKRVRIPDYRLERRA